MTQTANTRLGAAALLVSSIGVAYFLVYAAMFLVPSAAGIGPISSRAIQHFLGFWGLAILLQGLAASAWSKEVFKVNAVVLSGTVLAAWLVALFPERLSASAELNTVAMVICIAGTVYLIAILVLAFAWYRLVGRAFPRVTLMFCYGISIYWEVLYQPMVSVYGEAARHSVQVDQLAADLLGITFAYATLYGIALRPLAVAGTMAATNARDSS